MADNVNITPGTGKTVLADEITDGTLGTGVVQFVKIIDGDLDSTTKLGATNNFPSDLKKISGNAVSTGNGVAGTGVQRVTVASDNTPFAVKTDQTTHGTTDLVAADQTKIAGTAIDVNSGNKSAGTQRVVIATDQPELTNAQPIYIKPSTASNSLSSSNTICAATTNATSVKGSAGKVYYVALSNSDSIGYWFKMYDKATSPTVGTDVPVSTRYIPPGGGREIPLDAGSYFANGIAFAVTLNATDADTTAVTNANKVVVHMRYI